MAAIERTGPSLETLRTMILDSQESPLQTGVPRRVSIETVAGKATVCIGVRRGGKSTLLFQIIERLLADGVSRRNILYLNFFDDRLHGLGPSSLALIPEAYYSIYPEKQDVETVYCFFDEIQAVSGWEPFVDRLLRTGRCRIYLTGSSAQLLSREIATQMRGRALSWELFPFSLREFLDSRGIDSEGALSTRRRLLIRKGFEEYWERGGFPEVASASTEVKVRIHQEYFHIILYRDLVERHDVAHPRAVADLAHRLVDGTVCLYTVNSLTGYLKALGHRVPKSAVSDYLEWFEDAYFLFTVRIFDASLARRNTNPKKIYCIDHALVASVSAQILINSGHLLENLVFVTLRRRHQEISYYKTGNGREVDFIVPRRRAGPLLVQVCESLVDPATRKRETAALGEAMAELGVSSAIIVTRDEQERIESGGGLIEVLPIWRFLLDW